MADTDRVLVNRNGIAQVLGVSTPTVTKYVEQGLPVHQRGSRGVAWEFDAGNCVAWMLERREKQILRRLGFDDGEDLTLEAARTRLAMAQTESAELKNAVMRGDVVPARDVLEHWADQIVRVRTHLRSIPSQLKGSVPHLTAEEVVIARRLIDRACSELADGLPERDRGTEPESGGEVETAA